MQLFDFLPLNQKFVSEVFLSQQVNICFTTLVKLEIHTEFTGFILHSFEVH